MDEITFAVLGTGGIGRRALEVSQHKDALTPVAACDRHGVAIDFDGLDVDELLEATEGNIDNEVATDGGADAAVAEGGVKQHGEELGVVASEQARPSEDSIQDIIDHGDEIDAVLLALPNYEHDFIPRTAERFIEGDYSGVMIDVLKRSRVIDMLDDRREAFEDAGITFICGAGATPGLLTGAAALAAQSFVEVTDVDIHWGVGLKSGYEDNRGTVREDIAHLPEYDIETARDLSEEEIEEIIDDHDGVIEFEEVRVTGRTFDGETATNMFQLGDETSMEANVNGPALGYLKAGVRRNRAGEYGVFGPAELMPGF